MRRNKWLAGIGIAFFTVMILATGGFIYWANNPLPAQPAAINSLQSDAIVQIKTDPWYQFSPTEGSPQIGLILYPGGRVEALAYAPTARAIAEHGFLVVLPEMRLNLAVFSPDITEEIIASYPDIDTWAIGGHSLGGAMAARY
ncbi:MAG: alpha/beta hydrolase, partial [candidate division Zixibacteria bacterium]|nr:alpha/beta hydrolase [candidate division Zixibacteria bacterium]NIS46942.1 alpha/beta hydrolase [candidate division Zixibacteria bacterium]NIU15089.1 alpha/beta hydrolase [candidate division Zixibacteria bacterium]NIV07135.1 alpha/beta hydrolase [candidate division Zixibacteria bacterium]NIW46262.1 alpha/beta hydrolase [Gammaproteobacteria bacterium]